MGLVSGGTWDLLLGGKSAPHRKKKEEKIEN